MNPRLLGVPEAAVALGVTESYLRRGAAARSIPHTRLGRLVKFSDADLDAIVAAGQVRPVVSQLRRRTA